MHQTANYYYVGSQGDCELELERATSDVSIESIVECM